MADWSFIMINFSYEQKQELVKFIEDLGKSFGIRVICIDDKHKTLGLSSSNLAGFKVITDTDDFCGYTVAIDNMYFDKGFDICLPYTASIDEMKTAIKTTVFNSSAMIYLFNYLCKKGIDYSINTGEYGEFVNCEIFLKNGARFDAFFMYTPKNHVETYIEQYDDDEDDSDCYFSIEFTGGDLNQVKTLIKKTVDKWRKGHMI